MKTLKGVQEKIVATLKRWQKIEEEAIVSLTEIVEAFQNPLPRTVFEIIRQDSRNHRQVQELLTQAGEEKGFTLTVEEMEELSKVIARHVEVEKRMIEATLEALDSIKGKNMILHEYFMKYLQEEEKKHLDLLKGLENIKRYMHPYGPSA